MFYKAPFLLQRFFPRLTWRIRTDEKEVLLTFDDGPHPELTPFVMDELEKYGFRGTFFCIGDNVDRYPDVFEAITSRGHAVGNHTQHHLNGWKTPVMKYIEDVQQCQSRVDSALFRPPYGKITRVQRNKIAGRYRIIMWSLLSWDFRKNLNVQKSLRNLKKFTRPGEIVVFHDSGKAGVNMQAILPEYLSWLRENGYRSAQIK